MNKDAKCEGENINSDKQVGGVWRLCDKVCISKDELSDIGLTTLSSYSEISPKEVVGDFIDL